jgi:hypothetical protein
MDNNCPCTTCSKIRHSGNPKEWAHAICENISITNKKLDELILATGGGAPDNSAILASINANLVSILTQTTNTAGNTTNLVPKLQELIDGQTTGNLTLTYLAVIKGKDMDTANGLPEIPAELLRTLQYDLASDLADDYRLEIKERGYLMGKGDSLMMQAKKRDVDRSDVSMVTSAYPSRRR